MDTCTDFAISPTDSSFSDSDHKMRMRVGFEKILQISACRSTEKGISAYLWMRDILILINILEYKPM